MGLEAKKIFQSRFSWVIVALDELQGQVIAGMIISLFFFFSFPLSLSLFFIFFSKRRVENSRHSAAYLLLLFHKLAN